MLVTNSPAHDFLSNLNSLYFLPTVTVPTRVVGTSSTLIDNVLVNNFSYKYKTAVIYNDISDHMPIVFKVNFNDRAVTDESHQTVKRVYSDENLHKFVTALENYDWMFLYNAMKDIDPKLRYKGFIDVYSKIFDTCFTIKTGKRKFFNSPRKEWMTKDLVKSCKKNQFFIRTC